jgi:hypothetical protein
MLNATERKALTLTTFTAACVCFAPAEIVSGIFLLLVSLLLFRWDQAVLRREAASSSGLSSRPEGGADGGAKGDREEGFTMGASPPNRRAEGFTMGFTMGAPPPNPRAEGSSPPPLG